MTQRQTGLDAKGLTFDFGNCELIELRIAHRLEALVLEALAHRSRVRLVRTVQLGRRFVVFSIFETETVAIKLKKASRVKTQVQLHNAICIGSFTK